MRRPKTSNSLAVLLLAATPLLAQDVQLSIRVDEVIVPFSARDSEGRLVPGLTKEDFIVLEDARVQTVSQFSDDPVPLSAAVVIDTGLRKESLEAIQSSIPALIEAFSDFDEVAVYRYDNEVFQILNFVDEPILLDRVRLREALDTLLDLRPSEQIVAGEGNRLPPPGPTINGIPVIPRATVPLGRDQRVLHDAMHAAASDLRLRPESRRRLIMVVTDGTDERSEAEASDVQLSLLESDIQAYPIGLNVELLVRFTDSLDDYASMTGGRLTYADSESLELRYADITGQARNQYVLTYVSNNPIPQDRIPFREIEIQGPRGLEIEHRAGYYQVP